MAQAYNPDHAIAAARRFVGCKWRHRGRTRFGIDCIGLLVKAMQAGGILMRDRVDYGREPWNDGLQKELFAHFGEPVTHPPKAGDVALIHLPDNPAPSHIGLIGELDGRLTLIHSASELNVCEHGLTDDWLSCIVARYRP
ncbi:hypothetical protein AXE65_08840 [Ventosimonas gracilis]|uniref:NlpC/P60 domain-containing protein n=1 Tax=Ventosimonas gracilis TaxID=1680762 RepID=A0A139SXS1_9GAMM|nr:hypothetical protein [Ventosimonas gracilis]KXU39379.1 hypothetical protein AXE65_08840 [Ventosimonas gracilis]